MEPFVDPAVVIGLLAFGMFTKHRADFERYGLLTVGEFPRVDRRSVQSTGHSCADCGKSIRIGEHRHWYSETVVFGYIIRRHAGGVRRYCLAHSAHEVRDDLDPVYEFPRESAVEVFGRDVTGRIGLPDNSDGDPFRNVSSDVGGTAVAAFTLLPVALTVVCARAVLNAMSEDE